MKSVRLNKDSFIIGLIGGIVVFTIIYFALSFARKILLEDYPNAILLRPLAIPLIAMGLNIILFRLVMINYGKENTGKGILFSTVLITFAYFFVFYKSHR